MEEYLGFIESIREKTEELADTPSKKTFLEDCLKDKTKNEPELTATIYEMLGELYNENGEAKGSFYQKAASNWEIASMTKRGEEKEIEDDQYKMMKNALRDYNIACKIYKKIGDYSRIEEIKLKREEVLIQLRRHWGNGRKLAVVFSISVFLFSFIFLSSSMTGFIISPIETESATYTGAILALVGIVGMIIILRYWTY